MAPNVRGKLERPHAEAKRLEHCSCAYRIWRGRNHTVHPACQAPRALAQRRASALMQQERDASGRVAGSL